MFRGRFVCCADLLVVLLLTVGHCSAFSLRSATFGAEFRRSCTLRCTRHSVSRIVHSRAPVSCSIQAEVSSVASEDPRALVDDFLVWAKTAGIQSNLTPHDFDGLRGLRADKAISPGEEIVALPRQQTLFVGDKQPCPIPDFVSCNYWNRATLHVKLALVLLQEMSKGDDSRFRAWFKLLPLSHSDKPARWSPDLIKELDDEVLEEEIKQHRDKIDHWHEELRQLSPETPVSKEMFEWAMDTVISRSFGGQVSFGEISATWGSILLGLGMKANKALPALYSVMPLKTRVFMDGTAGSTELLIMQPFIDFCNHVTTASSETDFDYTSDTLRLRTYEMWQQGEQVNICYGCKSNRALLKSYGFVEVDNPVDETVLSGLLSIAEEIFLENNMGSNEAWQSRLGSLVESDLYESSERAQVSESGLSGRAAQALRILLSNPDEWDALRRLPGRQRAEFATGLETEQLILQAATRLCQRELEGIRVVPESATQVWDNATMSRWYRMERRKLLEKAIARMQDNQRLNRNTGQKVTVVGDSYLEKHQHDLDRYMNNLGF